MKTYRTGEPRGNDAALSCGRPIDRVFEMATKEVTVKQFLQFRPQPDYSPEQSPDPDCPINVVTWYDAAAYCRWLSEREGVAEQLNQVGFRLARTHRGQP
jgi:formylglycine-generating enzyme required for sulfatase activity